ncbi:MAG TPA: ArsA-related P-loop ATPase [Terriglobales bacterium]|nr:ArsA-related P-loop ATPase [Terriglobales bacterium]
MTLEQIIAAHKIVICAGSGGVGKTTTAASIAVLAASQGRRVVVMTIDPAKRLANALGLQSLGGSLVEVPLDDEGHNLSAMMLDQKGAWDELVDRHAPSPEVRDRILENHFYQNLSQTFAGSQEYMAIEQLCELYDRGQFDLIVVDTPPTRHALDFLEAPQRLADFLDRNVVKWFVRPYFSAGWSTMRFVNRTAGFLFKRLEDATGVSALVEVSEFFTAMSSLFEGFEPRVRRVYELLRSPETAFVLVASPEEQVLREAEFFTSKVAELGMALRAVVFNRVHWEARSARRRGKEKLDVRALLANRDIAAPLAEALAVNFDRYEAIGRGDALRMEAFRNALPQSVVVLEVPNFNTDIHSVEGLKAMHPFLRGRHDTRQQ